MGRASYCEKTGLRKGPWTAEEDKILFNYIMNNEHETWRALPKLAGLLRCGKSCRLRWENYLKPDIKRGSFTKEEERIIIQLHALLGNRWSTIASQLPGRTDNTIKNFWNTHLKKRLFKLGIDPSTHAARAESKLTAPQVCNARHKAQWENVRLEAEARLSTESLPSSSNCETGYQINNTVDLITMRDNNAPTDFFSKIWNSEAGKAFRKQSSARTIIKSYNNSCHVFDQNHPNGGGDDQVLSSELTKIPGSSGSLCSLPCVSPAQHCCGQSLNPKAKLKENGTQLQCNSASYEWIGHCNVKISEALSGFGDMTMGQTEHNVPQGFCSFEELGLAHMHYTDCSELLLDFPDNNNNTGRMITELHTSFGQHSGWPWPELRIEEDNKDCRNNVSTINAHS